LILTIELIPESSWGLNLRNKLTFWQKISQEIQSKAQYKCEICGREKGNEIKRLHCHEIWNYDFAHSIQKLVGLQSLCIECHYAKHPGFTSFQSWIDEESIKKHFLKVNKISHNEYSEYLKRQVEIWNKASMVQWKIDYGEWNYLIDEEFQKEQVKLIYNYIENHKSATNEQIYQELYNSSNILKSAIAQYIIKARRILKQEESSEEFQNKQIQLICNYIKNHKRATNEEIYQELYNSSDLLKTAFTKYVREARKKIKLQHIENIFRSNYK